MSMLDRTSDIAVATYLINEGHVRLKSIEGVPGRRVFIFDRSIPADLIHGYYSSPAKKLIDTFRGLKTAAMTGP
jgi:hypothetical protein